MPIYEYRCATCEADFEELLMSRDEIKQYSESHPCPQCKLLAPRLHGSVFGFSFKGDVRGTSGVHGNSGVHDLDYPTLDKAVARSSEKKWGMIKERQKSINEARKSLNTNAIASNSDGSYSAVDKSVLKTREDGIGTFKKSIKSDE
jgi:hypothetical protein